jgi:hypothetical protein
MASVQLAGFNTGLQRAFGCVSPTGRTVTKKPDAAASPAG